MVFSNTFSPFLAFPVRSLVVSALAAASLAACSHTTRMAAQPQNLPVPAEWANATAPAAAPATALASDAPAAPALDLAQWWQGFGDAQLVTLIEQALAANPSIVSAQAAVQQARAQVEVQRAGLLPSLDASEFIVATDKGMMHKLRQLNPGKTFYEAPTAGNSATCKSCAHCPWMAMNGLAGVAHVLETGANAVHVDPALIPRARLPIDRMLAFTAGLKNGQSPGALVPHFGAA